MINYQKLPNKLSFLLIGLVVIYYLAGVITIKHFPIISVDEGWQWNNALLYSKPDFKSINSPFFELRHGIPYPVDLLLGLIAKYFGLGIVQGRLLILTISLAVLLLLFRFTSKVYNTTIAFWAIIFLISTDTFLSGSRIIRSDILLAVYLLIWARLFYSYLQNKNLLRLLGSSFILAFATDVHQNGAIFFIASFVTLGIAPENGLRRKFKSLVIYLVGPLIYAIYYLFAHILPNGQSFWALNSYSFFNDHPLPLLALQPIELVTAEIERYVNYFVGPRIVEFAVIIAGFGYTIFQKQFKHAFIAWFVFFSAVLFSLLSPNKLSQYFVTFYPFYAIFAGLLLSVIWHFVSVKTIDFNIKLSFNWQSDKSQFFYSKTVSKLASLLTIIFILLFFSLNTARIYFRLKNSSTYDLQAIGNQINQVIPQNSKVMGLPYWLLALPDHQLISFYTLSWYRVIEKMSLEEAIYQAGPDILIVDKYTNSYLVDDENAIKDYDFQRGLYAIYRPKLSAIIKEKGTLITTLPDYFIGPVEVYSLKIR